MKSIAPAALFGARITSRREPLLREVIDDHLARVRMLAVVRCVGRVADTSTAILNEKAVEESLVREWARTAFAGLGSELAQLEKHGRNARQVPTPVNAIGLLGYALSGASGG